MYQIQGLDKRLKNIFAEAIGNDPNFFGDVNARFDAVEETVEENEEVTSAALNDLNDRINGIVIPVVPTTSTTLIEDDPNPVSGGAVYDVVVENERVTSSALNDLNSKKQDNLESGVNIKTVNGFSLVGSGDVVIKTYRGLPASWDINHTMADLIDSIAADTSAVPGESYMGTVHLSDLPGGLSQGELIIEVMDELSGDKTVLFQLSSADTSPYKWEYNSAYGRTGAWRSWVTNENQTTITFIQW